MSAIAAIPARPRDEAVSPAGDLDAELQNLFDWTDDEDDPFVLSCSFSVCCPY